LKSIFKTSWLYPKTTIIVNVIIGMMILAALIYHYWLRFELNHYVAELAAKGEPMELSQVLPPMVPPGQNGVPLITNMLAYLESTNTAWVQTIVGSNLPPAMMIVAPGKAMIGWQQFDIRTPDGTNTWKDLNYELAGMQDKLAGFYCLTNGQTLDFGLDYSKGYSLRLLHLEPLEFASSWLESSVMAALHEQETSNACQAIRAMLAIAKGQTKEPLEFSQNIRIAIARHAEMATWEVLQATNATERDLLSLQQDWQSLDFIEPVEQAYLTERVIRLRAQDEYRRNPGPLWRFVQVPDWLPTILPEGEWRWFSSCADEKRAAQTFQVSVEATRIAKTTSSFRVVQLFASTNFLKLGFDPKEYSEDGLLMDMDMFTMREALSYDAYRSFRLLRNAMSVETGRSMLMVAMALKRYQIQHHHLPGTLNELIPDYLETIPLDFMDGQPLHYRANADGTFLLYSVGENGKDDGGNPSLERPEQDAPPSWLNWQSRNAFDWVWPQPATAAEIQKFYDQLGKESK
jgi:hypothetical protein